MTAAVALGVVPPHPERGRTTVAVAVAAAAGAAPAEYLRLVPGVGRP